ncbi:hypothetical protein FOZ61_001663, partial [Perkinsus olseni]
LWFLANPAPYHLDDILVFSPDAETHEDHLRQVFARLRAWGLTLSAEKCEFGCPAVPYLGHIFDGSGMRPDPTKVEAILRWPRPCNVAEIRSFLGLADYYRNFVPNFSDVARPIQRLVSEVGSETVPLDTYGGEEQEKSFRALKLRLAALPFLAYPDFDAPFELYTDASDYAIGAVLMQDGRPLGFFSRTLTGSQLNWHTYEKEAYGILQALIHFQHYHIGYPLTVTVYTDHEPLTWLAKAGSKKLERWLLAMQAYSFTVKYVPGKKNVCADALSRIRRLDDKALPMETMKSNAPPTRSAKDADTTQALASVVAARRQLAACITALSTRWSTDDILREQDSDDVTRKVKERLADPLPLRRTELTDLSFRPYKQLWDQLDVLDGLLVRRRKFNNEREPRVLPVIPPALRADVVDSYHEEDGHFAVRKTLDKLKLHAYWPGMGTDLLNHEKTCPRCTQVKATVPRAPLGVMPIGKPWDLIAIDHLKVPPNDDNIRSLLVVQDYFTRWATAIPVKSEDTTEVVRALLDLFSVFGPPGRVHSDQGSAFESNVLRVVLERLGVEKSHTTPYHPSGDELVERFNRSLIGLLRTHVTDSRQWPIYLPSLLWHYNSSVHSATRFAPYTLMFGREPKSVFLPSLQALDQFSFDPFGYNEYVKALTIHLEDLVDLTHASASAAARAYYDKKATARQFYIGQRVLVRRLGPQAGNKLEPKWSPGWFVVGQMPSQENKVLKLKHQETLQVRVLSADYVAIDPTQPDAVPDALGIIRQDPLLRPGSPLPDPDLNNATGPEPPVRPDVITDNQIPGDGLPCDPLAGPEIPPDPDAQLQFEVDFPLQRNARQEPPSETISTATPDDVPARRSGGPHQAEEGRGGALDGRVEASPSQTRSGPSRLQTDDDTDNSEFQSATSPTSQSATSPSSPSDAPPTPVTPPPEETAGAPETPSAPETAGALETVGRPLGRGQRTRNPRERFDPQDYVPLARRQ